jgi:serine/threonine-protein kinase RsbW
VGLATKDAGGVSCAFTSAQVAPLRRLLATYARDSGMPDAREHDFVLAVDECLTNAVQHGGGGGWLRVWITESALCFRVSDAGGGLPDVGTKADLPGPTVPGGRGLWIAQQLADAMTIISGPEGTTVEGTFALI